MRHYQEPWRLSGLLLLLGLILLLPGRAGALSPEKPHIRRRRIQRDLQLS